MVCSTLNDDEIQTCAQGVYDWWPSITEALFKYQGTGDVICVGACQCRGSSCGVKSILKQVSTALVIIVTFESWPYTIGNVNQGLLELDGRNSQKYLHQT